MLESMELADFKGTARLFPLPNLVLFPQVVQGLHIFENRYRQMMADALASDRLISLVMLKPGWEENYDGRPEIETVACLGRVTWYEKLDDGRYNLRLRGLSRIRLISEVATDRLYRIAEAELIPDQPASDSNTAREYRQSLAKLVLPQFEDTHVRRQLQELFDGEMSLGQLCDVLSYALPLPMELKQALLGESLTDRRAIALITALQTHAEQADRPFPPPFSEN
jgi:uncharacterized protein